MRATHPHTFSNTTTMPSLLPLPPPQERLLLVAVLALLLCNLDSLALSLWNGLAGAGD